MHVMRVLVLSVAWSSKHYTHTLHTPYTTSIEHTHTETKLNWLVTVRRGVLCTVWVCVLLMMLSSDCCMTWFVSAAAIYLHLLLVTVVSTISIVRSYGNGRWCWIANEFGAIHLFLVTDIMILPVGSDDYRERILDTQQFIWPSIGLLKKNKYKTKFYVTVNPRTTVEVSVCCLCTASRCDNDLFIPKRA